MKIESIGWAVSKQLPSFSFEVHIRPVAMHAIDVVNVPAKGSRTVLF